jgi:serine/threonine-protein kinase
VIVEICQQALRGLAYAHERGVIHRDISADNLVVSFDGVVKVVDFGIAHGAGEAQERVTTNVSAPSEKRLTQAGGIIGKMAYMPPERLQGAEATASGDLYALGCVIYELLFGDLPDSSLEGLPLPRLERPDAPAAYQQLRNVLAIALHLDPKRRFADARAFLLALEPVRHALPAVELSSWLRENFAERWTRERELSELGDPTPAEVEALLTRESAVAPGADSEATRLLGPRAAPPAGEQTTRIIERPR